jgi:hypothetical protein
MFDGARIKHLALIQDVVSRLAVDRRSVKGGP